MKKLILLIVIGLAGWYLYQHAGVLKSGAQQGNVADSQQSQAAQQAGGNEAPAAASSDSGTSGAKVLSDTKEIIGCDLIDENGDKFDFGSFLLQNKDKVVMLCVDIANRPHCAAGGDDNMRALYHTLDDLQNKYSDRVQVVGYNFSGSLEQVRDYKSYYGFNYPMLTFPANVTASSVAEAKQMTTFLETFNGVNCPEVMFIKDGSQVVRTASDIRDNSALEGILKELL
jgi:hypothetical protein